MPGKCQPVFCVQQPMTTCSAEMDGLMPVSQRAAFFDRKSASPLIYRSLFALVFVGLLGGYSPLRVDAAEPVSATSASLTDWLTRINEASRRRAFTGTFVVSTAQAMSSARIWHVCDGAQQLERVDTLTGPARTTVRRNDEVVTFIPEARTTVLERRETLGLFPALLQTQGQSVKDHYNLKPLGAVERVAGFDAEVHDLTPKDDLRFGYRVWSERKTGLVLKIQTLDGQQRVLEQVAFSELNLDTPLKVDALAKLMKNRPGYTVQTITAQQTTPAEQGWRLRKDVPGFQTIGCQIKDVTGPEAGRPPLQWVLSDGLASVSLFIEAFDPKRHVQEGTMASGATHSMARRLGDHWLTLVGEVPARTLNLFAQELERAR